MTARRRRPAARKIAARKTTPRKTAAAPKTTAVDIGAEVARLGTTLAGEADFAKCLDHLLTAARRVTGAEAGTVYVRRGDMLEFAAVQNEVLERHWTVRGRSLRPAHRMVAHTGFLTFARRLAGTETFESEGEGF